MQPKFTPGPWGAKKSNQPGWIVIGEDGRRTLAHVAVGMRVEANARLMSAAPDLLAVAKTYAMHAVDCHVRPFGGGLRATWAGDDYKVCTCALGDAIRKAEGRDGAA